MKRKRFPISVLIPFFALGCSLWKKPPPGPDAGMAWLDLEPGSIEICVAALSDAPRLRNGKTVLPMVRQHIEAVQLDEARSLLTDLDTHPQVEIHWAAIELLERNFDSAWQRVRGLLAQYPEDACLNHFAAVTQLLQGQWGLARGHADDAVTLSGGHAEMRFLQAIIADQQGMSETGAEFLRAAIAKDPMHEGASALLAAIYLENGDGELALPLLEVASDGGVDVSALLAPAYYDAGRLDDYIRVASRHGWPLGDAGALANELEPMAALGVQLGVGPLGRLVAELDTSMGTIRCDLLWKQTPVTVANFVHLAKGQQEWTHPETGETRTDPLYSGTIFHRVIPKFMIQGGDPIGMGTGGPGYSFVDEIHPSHRFDSPGLLAMANSGPNTNGSQWFVTEVPTPHLNGRHTLFGRCDEESLSIVQQIGSVARQPNDRPVEDVVLREIRIVGL